jgi:hypothetical protein
MFAEACAAEVEQGRGLDAAGCAALAPARALGSRRQGAPRAPAGRTFRDRGLAHPELVRDICGGAGAR